MLTIYNMNMFFFVFLMFFTRHVSFVKMLISLELVVSFTLLNFFVLEMSWAYLVMLVVLVSEGIISLSLYVRSSNSSVTLI